MLILPPGHAQSVRVWRGFTRREKWILSSVLAVVAVLIVAVVISIGAGSDRRTGNGCVDVTFPIAIGGQEVYECGARAQALCRSAGTSLSPNPVADRAIMTQCRKAGLKVGS